MKNKTKEELKNHLRDIIEDQKDSMLPLEVALDGYTKSLKAHILQEERERVIEIIQQAFGEVSALFMSQETKGTEIEMPTEELIRISEETINKLQ